MTTPFDPKPAVTPAMLETLWAYIATNHRQQADVADDLAQAALAQATQNRFDELFKRQGTLQNKAEELQTSLEQAYREYNSNAPNELVTCRPIKEPIWRVRFVF